MEVLTAAMGKNPQCDCEPCKEAMRFALSAFLNGIAVGIEMEKQ
jgi:hypothetical protein